MEKQENKISQIHKWLNTKKVDVVNLDYSKEKLQENRFQLIIIILYFIEPNNKQFSEALKLDTLKNDFLISRDYLDQEQASKLIKKFFQRQNMAWTDQNVVNGVVHNKSLNAILHTNHNCTPKTINHVIDFIYHLIEIEENTPLHHSINDLYSEMEVNMKKDIEKQNRRSQSVCQDYQSLNRMDESAKRSTVYSDEDLIKQNQDDDQQLQEELDKYENLIHSYDYTDAHAHDGSVVDKGQVNDFDYPDTMLDQYATAVSLSEQIDIFEGKIDQSLQSDKNKHKILNEDDQVFDFKQSNIAGYMKMGKSHQNNLTNYNSIYNQMDRLSKHIKVNENCFDVSSLRL